MSFKLIKVLIFSYCEYYVYCPLTPSILDLRLIFSSENKKSSHGTRFSLYTMCCTLTILSFTKNISLKMRQHWQNIFFTLSLTCPYNIHHFILLKTILNERICSVTCSLCDVTVIEMSAGKILERQGDVYSILPPNSFRIQWVKIPKPILDPGIVKICQPEPALSSFRTVFYIHRRGH